MAGRLLAGALLLLACGGVRPAAACAPNGDDKVTIGGDTYVCVVVNFKTYMVAVPKADEYSRVAISGSYLNTDNFGPGYPRSDCTDATLYNHGTRKSDGLCQWTTVHVESHGGKSLAKAYKVYAGGVVNETTAPRYVYPVLTAVISVFEGAVQAITWDDGCYFCDSLTNNADGTNEVCQPNIFSSPNATELAAATTTLAAAQTLAAEQALPFSEEQLVKAQVDGHGDSCITYGPGHGTNANGEDCSKNDGAVCDLKIYVVWTGTDANGAYFQSAGLRFSRFQQFAISSLYTSARTLALDTYAGAESAAQSTADTVSSRL